MMTSIFEMRFYIPNFEGKINSIDKFTYVITFTNADLYTTYLLTCELYAYTFRINL